MTDNRATELREKLDALEIEHFDYDKGGRTQTQWEATDGKRHFTYETQDNPAKTAKLVISWFPTPEQAISATLGSHERTCKLDGFADVRFSVDYEVDGYAVGSSSDYATLEECSSCGAYVIEPPAYHHVLTCDGDEIYQPYNYCPNCGCEVER